MLLDVKRVINVCMAVMNGDIWMRDVDVVYVEDGE